MPKNSEVIDYICIRPQCKPKKIIFLFHGYAQRASYMMNVLGKKLAMTFPEFVIYSLNGLHECKDYKGKKRYDWLYYNGEEDWNPEIAYNIANKNSKIINQFIESKILESELEYKDCALIGFSQGTRICLHMGLRMNSPCAAILGYSGALSFSLYTPKEIRVKPRIMLIHGDKDKIIPYQESIEAEKLLKLCKVNAQVRILSGVAHEISNEGVNIGAKFLADAFDFVID